MPFLLLIQIDLPEKETAVVLLLTGKLQNCRPLLLKTFRARAAYISDPMDHFFFSVYKIDDFTKSILRKS